MTAFTVSEIFIRAQHTFGDESAVQLRGDMILNWVNDAQMEAVNQIPNLLPETANLNSVVDQSRYSNLPENMFTLWGVKYKDSGLQSYYQLKYMTLVDLYQNYDGWDGQVFKSGVPSIYAREKNDLIIFPPPRESVTDGIKLVYARYPNKLAQESDPIDLPEYLNQFVIDFVMHHAYEMDEDWAAADRLSQRVQSTLNANKETPEDRLHQGTYPTVSGDTWVESL